MNYELAKQLKEAGFPQKTPLTYPPYRGELDTSHLVGVYIPTLSELIEACGEPLTLKIMVNRTDAIMGGSEIEATGSTPEEAVAKLWLALNSKK